MRAIYTEVNIKNGIGELIFGRMWDSFKPKTFDSADDNFVFSLYLEWLNIEQIQWLKFDSDIRWEIQKTVISQVRSIVKELKEQQRFYFIADSESTELALFDCHTSLLWDLKYSHNQCINLEEAEKLRAQSKKFLLENWNIPGPSQVHELYHASDDELQSAIFRGEEDCWITTDGPIDSEYKPCGIESTDELVDSEDGPVTRRVEYFVSQDLDKDGYGHLLMCNEISAERLVMQSLNQGWWIQGDLHHVGLGISFYFLENFDWKKAIGYCKNGAWRMPCLDIRSVFAEIDRTSITLPELENNQISDKGLWELNNLDFSMLRKLNISPRDPAQDVQPWPVAIDFGTSSTVVAYKEGGKKHLIRVGGYKKRGILHQIRMGVKDYFDSIEPEHFENPTALAFIDLDKALPQWQETAYKPSIRWGDIRCSHEALSELKDNEGDPEVTSSILTNLKHWALREDKTSPARIKDRVNQREMVLPPLELRNPIKGLPLTVSPDDNFDPIELYAYYLGLTINWRKRGIFLRYCMTFPVTYPQRIKDKILASFRRGLQRSLPETLITQDIFNRFEVEEIASEPVAFAAAALQQHNIEPTAEGVTYAVFDFGGGTTDFDFGIYREPTDDEDDEGYDIVFEHFGASGDSYLGGENLLENLAYLVFKANQSLLREHRIAISMPVNADIFPGSEMLIDTTLAALTNTQIVMSRLRSYMEQGLVNSQGIEKIKLLNRSNKEVNLELEIPYEGLRSYLEERIQSGVDKFFTAMHGAFSEHSHQPQEVHILLAGNASRSVILKKVLQNIIGVEPSPVFEEQVAPSPTTELRAPVFPESVADGTIVTWAKQPGEAVFRDEVLCEIETDKVVLEVIAPCNGLLSKIRKHNGSAVFSDDVIALISDHPPTLANADEPGSALQADDSVRYILHSPLNMSSEQPDKVTAKTGVALGLLDLVPGNPVKIVNHAREKSAGEAPFKYYIGRIRRGHFQPQLKRNASYQAWQEVGVVLNGRFDLVYTTSPLAHDGTLEASSDELNFIPLELAQLVDKQRLFARAIAPDKIEICTAESAEGLDQVVQDNFQVLELG